MDRYITGPQSLASSSPADPFAAMDPSLGMEEADNPPVTTGHTSGPVLSSAQGVLTPEIRCQATASPPTNHQKHCDRGEQNIHRTKGGH